VQAVPAAQVRKDAYQKIEAGGCIPQLIHLCAKLVKLALHSIELLVTDFSTLATAAT
jgi:hypothetical protein